MSGSNCSCSNSSEIACKISVFDSKERKHYDQLRKELTEIMSVIEISNGYTFIFPNQPSLLVKIAEWILLENRCCPFIKFSLNASGESDSIRLELTGNEEVKNLLREEFRLL
jgi:hypothetical protein